MHNIISSYVPLPSLQNAKHWCNIYQAQQSEIEDCALKCTLLHGVCIDKLQNCKRPFRLRVTLFPSTKFDKSHMAEVVERSFCHNSEIAKCRFMSGRIEHSFDDPLVH